MKKRLILKHTTLYQILSLFGLITVSTTYFVYAQRDSRFFDIEKFIREQTRILNQESPKVLKSIQTNGKNETKTVRISNWELELKLFELSHINSPSLADSYKTITSGNMVFYQSKYKNLKTKKISIQKDENQQAKQIMIWYEENNVLFDIKRILTLQLTDGKLVQYTITSSEHIIFMSPKTLQVTGNIL